MDRFVYRIRSGYSDRRVGSKVYVLGPGGTMHILDNATAVFLWDAIGTLGKGEIDKLVNDLVGHFDVSPEIARSDVADFLSCLEGLEVLEKIPLRSDRS